MLRALAHSGATWPTNMIIGLESRRAMWMPGEALRLGPRVTKQSAWRPVAFPTASAIAAAFLAAHRHRKIAVMKGVEDGEIASRNVENAAR